MAMLRYGKIQCEIDESIALAIGSLIKAIVDSGRTEWLALPTRAPRTMELLISPGVPVSIDYSSDTHGEDQLKVLFDTYLPARDETPRERED